MCTRIKMVRTAGLAGWVLEDQSSSGILNTTSASYFFQHILTGQISTTQEQSDYKIKSWNVL